MKPIFYLHIEPFKTNYEEHSYWGANLMQALIAGLFIGMSLVVMGFVFSMSSLSGIKEGSTILLVVGVPLFIVCLILIMAWKKYSKK